MIRSFLDELWQSSDAIFQNHLSWLLITGPIAILGQNVLSEATCFTLAGIALIPCAERLSFVTEQVALHTNASIGALLNATFGNAPELLIATAAIRSGFYRLTQLTMLGSMITNMVFVFGLSCFVGGLRWQTQELHASTAVIAMLLLSTAGSLIPAALVLSGHFTDSGGRSVSTPTDQDRVLENLLTRNTSLTITPSQEEITLSRVNAAVMLIAYVLYLIFQLGTHVNEVSPERQSKRDNPPRPNLACRRLFKWAIMPLVRGIKKRSSNMQLEFSSSSTVLHHNASSKSSSRRHPDVNGSSHHSLSEIDDSVDEHDEHDDDDDEDDDAEAVILLKKQPSSRMRDDSERSHMSMFGGGGGVSNSGHSGADPLRIRETGGGTKHVLVVGGAGSSDHSADPLRLITPPARRPLTTRKSKDSDHHNDDDHHHHAEPPRLTMRVGIFWLFVVTMCISAMSDILVDTIDGFAQRMRLSQVFTSMVIIPFFSNIAEQVSSVIFGYRNEYVHIQLP
jgi:Ca2+/H+ antiporter